jgi:hypothetical protein
LQLIKTIEESGTDEARNSKIVWFCSIITVQAIEESRIDERSQTPKCKPIFKKLANT